MPMTTIVTRAVSDRMRGLLASSMLELAPGVYSQPRMSAAVRERLWETVENWWPHERDGSIIMLWADNAVPGGQSVLTLGLPPVGIVEVDGLLLSRRPLTGKMAEAQANKKQ